VTEGAKVLGVTRQAFNNLVNGKSAISPEMAVRLSKAFGGSPSVWLKMQMDYDLVQVEKTADKIKVRRALCCRRSPRRACAGLIRGRA
jgi:addiction module HigA family antidote